MQPKNIFYIPVNETYQVLNDQLTGIAISEKLFNNGRYEPGGTGIGTAKESFCTRYDIAYFVDPNKSLPYKITLEGVFPISGKMSNYFKSVIQLAYSTGRKLLMFYNDFHEEVVLAIQGNNALIFTYPFNSNWNPLNNYIITGSQVTSTPNGINCTVSYNSSTGLATYTPNTGFVGTNIVPFTFNTSSGAVTLNTSLTWTSGTTNVNSFVFNAKDYQPLSTTIYSNSISVIGNTIPAPISIGGGQYSVNGGAFTSSSGTVNNGDIVQVSVISSGLQDGLTSCTLTISSQSATFNVTTIPTGGGGTNFYVNNNSAVQSVSYVSYSGASSGTISNIPPGSNSKILVTTGTYSVTCKLQSVPGAYVNINGTESFVNGGNSVTVSSLSLPIYVTITDMP